MKNTTPTIEVIYRYFDGCVIAIFPTELADMNYYNCDSYMAVGQHGACDPQYVIESSEPIRKDNIFEMLKLQRELENIGYNLKRVFRYTAKYQDIRKKKLREMLAV